MLALNRSATSAFFGSADDYGREVLGWEVLGWEVLGWEVLGWEVLGWERATLVCEDRTAVGRSQSQDGNHHLFYFHLLANLGCIIISS
jgi:hypothetical protein